MITQEKAMQYRLKSLICLFLMVFLFLGMARHKVEKMEINREPELQFSFGVFADVQYMDWESIKSRHYRKSVAKLKQIVEDYNGQNLEFVIHLGDAIDADWESFETIMPLFKNFKAPVYHVVGNHDYSVENEEKEKVLSVFGLERGYYSFDIGQNWKFFVLDGNEVSFFKHPFGTPGHDQVKMVYEPLKQSKAVNAQSYNGAISQTQLQWLWEGLTEACLEDKRVIVFNHYPIYPKDKHNLWNDDQLLETIEPFSCVKAYFAGHNHAGNYGEKKGVHYVTMEAVVETADQNAYAVVDVYDDRLHIKGFDRTQSRELKLRLK